MNKLNHEEIMVSANRKYKDTVFRMIFRNKKELLSLYNAVNESHYEKEEDLQIVTLENAIYMNFKNDLAFLVDFHLYLYEHQSTCNPNIPLRNLFYVSREYQKMVNKKSLYSSAAVKIPAPKFIVFYNGIRQIPEKVRLKLSDSYFTKEAEPDLELKVTMFNINFGHNQKLMDECRTLKEYMLYVQHVRKYAEIQNMTLEEAVECAVTECIRNNILADFLRQNRAEAISMSIFEYDEEREKALFWEAERQAVRDAVREEMREDVEREMREEILREMACRMRRTGKYELEEIADIFQLPLEKISAFM